jgi:hypothetical protein
MPYVFLVLIVSNLYYLAAIEQAAIVNILPKSNIEEGHAVSNFWSYTLTATPHTALSPFLSRKLLKIQKFQINTHSISSVEFLLVQSQELKTSFDSGTLGLTIAPFEIFFFKSSFF